MPLPAQPAQQAALLRAGDGNLEAPGIAPHHFLFGVLISHPALAYRVFTLLGQTLQLSRVGPQSQHTGRRVGRLSGRAKQDLQYHVRIRPLLHGLDRSAPVSLVFRCERFPKDLQLGFQGRLRGYSRQHGNQLRTSRTIAFRQLPYNEF